MTEVRDLENREDGKTLCRLDSCCFRRKMVLSSNWFRMSDFQSGEAGSNPVSTTKFQVMRINCKTEKEWQELPYSVSKVAAQRIADFIEQFNSDSIEAVKNQVFPEGIENLTYGIAITYLNKYWSNRVVKKSLQPAEFNLAMPGDTACIDWRGPCSGSPTEKVIKVTDDYIKTTGGFYYKSEGYRHNEHGAFYIYSITINNV